MSSLPDLSARNKEYYRIDVSTNLPPGTDTVEQFENNPRQPRPPATPKRPVPEWPQESERKGKWISKYLDQLDPETEYDQIIRTVNFFQGTSFAIAIGYCSTFIHLTQPPAGAAAIHHGGKAYSRRHQRFYDTQNHFLDWMWYGSGSEETKQDIERINKLHASIWKNVPGSYSHPWEGQMSVIGSAYFETYLRRLSGARNQDPHPHLAAAWPAWAERACAHFRTEPDDGSRSYGINFPRNWEELSGFYLWFQNLPFDQYTSAEDREKGHRIAEAFVDEFSTLWFPRQLHWLGRSVLLTVLARKVRDQQQLGHPNPIVEAAIKFGFKVLFDLTDLLPDPAKPVLLEDYRAIKEWDRFKIDAKVETDWKRRASIIDVLLATFLVLCAAVFLARGYLPSI
ncbi:hypothetical protein NM208_g5552 [Fusarium decemcellulare]|uniref:Uncharacterized protein n=1 Tax=Fusarium decemcellulare TaxID=57161 RepID=A0ACC1SGM7_9HYPO|nr:hypothetical protein NM208_g5552 [Fusarium decemcellulare]